MREKLLENKIKNELKKAGAYFVKYFGCSFTQAGVPDILSCVRGHFLAIEVKNEKGKPSDLQKKNIFEIKKCGGIGIVCRPDDFENVKRIITCLALNDVYQAKQIADEINCKYL